MKTVPQKTHDGKVVAVNGNKLTTVCDKGKEHNHTVAKDAKVCCDGHPSKLADLKAGTCVRVTVDSGDKKTATAVDSGKFVTGTIHDSKA